MATLRARLVETENEEGGLAVIEVNGERVFAMDCLGYGIARTPNPGEEFDARFSCLYNDAEDWNTVFSGNPEQLKRIERIGLWGYRVFGQIVSVQSSEQSEALVNCEAFCLPAPMDVSDERCIGKYVAFTIDRLSVWCEAAT